MSCVTKTVEKTAVKEDITSKGRTRNNLWFSKTDRKKSSLYFIRASLTTGKGFLPPKLTILRPSEWNYKREISSLASICTFLSISSRDFFTRRFTRRFPRELLQNSRKHSFSSRRRGILRIQEKRSDSLSSFSLRTWAFTLERRKETSSYRTPKLHQIDRKCDFGNNTTKEVVSLRSCFDTTSDSQLKKQRKGLTASGETTFQDRQDRFRARILYHEEAFVPRDTQVVLSSQDSRINKKSTMSLKESMHKALVTKKPGVLFEIQYIDFKSSWTARWETRGRRLVSNFRSKPRFRVENRFKQNGSLFVRRLPSFLRPASLVIASRKR